MHPFHQLLATFSKDDHTRGKQFEVLCKWLLGNKGGLLLIFYKRVRG